MRLLRPLAVMTGGLAALAAATAPPQAAGVGYLTRTFAATFTAQEIDRGNTRESGRNWYVQSFFGGGVTTAYTLNADGSATLGDTGAANTGIMSAGIAADGRGWVGTVFGGGAYFEATLKFDPALWNQSIVDAEKISWPAWWSLPIEHAVSLPANYWPGQAERYEHYAEMDFFEYCIPDYGTPPRRSYMGTMHDWSGVWRPGVSKIDKRRNWAADRITIPEGTAFTAYHRYGLLWVPATATAKGYVRYYFDDLPQHTVTWDRLTDQAPTPPDQLDPWTFGVADRQHFVLILGSGAGIPMTVASVSAWQKDAMRNGRDGRLPVSIHHPPRNLRVAAGQAAIFSILAHGTPAPTYQWKRNGAAISGATGATLTIPAAAAGDDGAVFQVEVGNGVGGSATAEAVLRVVSAVGGGSTSAVDADGGGSCGHGALSLLLLPGLLVGLRWRSALRPAGRT